MAERGDFFAFHMIRDSFSGISPVFEVVFYSQS